MGKTIVGNIREKSALTALEFEEEYLLKSISNTEIAVPGIIFISL